MANICENTFYAQSDDENNIKYLETFLSEKMGSDVYSDIDFVEAYFSSRRVFPEEEMNDMYEGLPNKSNIYMRCLSIEYGCLYHALWICENEKGWTEV